MPVVHAVGLKVAQDHVPGKKCWDSRSVFTADCKSRNFSFFSQKRGSETSDRRASRGPRCRCVRRVAFVFAASVLQAMAVLVCAEMYQVKRLQHLCEVCVCAYLQSMPSRELASTGISVIRLLRRAKVSPVRDPSGPRTGAEAGFKCLSWVCFSVPQRRAAVHLAPPLYRQQLPDLQPQTRFPGALR